MEFLLEAIAQLICDFLLQIIFQLLVEGLYRLIIRTVKSESTVSSFIKYFLCGGIIGGVSLLVVPHSFIKNLILKRVSLLLIPTLIAVTMTVVGKLRTKQGKELVKLDMFSYAFFFAFGMCLVRYWAPGS